ncbi:hypothetical protein GCM10028807_40700 [Spirosoma daeguense]
MRSLFLAFSFLPLFTSSYSLAQTHTHNEIEIDSLTFAKTRQAVNAIPTDKFQKRIFNKNSVEIPYRLLLPSDYSPNETYPLVITLHNSTRLGSDNENQLEPLSRIWLRADIYTNYKCFVVAPQFKERSSNYKPNAENILVSTPSSDVPNVLELIKDLKKEYPAIDRRRVYLVGYSMGGSTAQNLLNREPETFAAVVSMAGVPDVSNIDEMSKKKIWLIHGKRDDENPYAGSVALFDKLNKNKKLLFTTYSNLDHNNITIPFLLSSDIPKWLFNK